MFISLIQYLKPLLHYPEFKLPRKRSLLKTLWEKEKMPLASIFSLSHIVFYPYRKKIIFFRKCILSSVNAFNLDNTESLSFVKRVNSAPNDEISVLS